MISPLKDVLQDVAGQELQRVVDSAADTVVVGGVSLASYTGEFWTAKQRQASSIHEISYRACFKPQLPQFFIHLFTVEGDVVYDPFSGRGTTVLEAGLMGRKCIANDANPLSSILTKPRFFVPSLWDLQARIEQILSNRNTSQGTRFPMFYHPKTEREILALRAHLLRQSGNDTEDDVDRWIRMVATNRLTGHSTGFFSVYTLPPNQALTPERQVKINKRLRQRPVYRDVQEIILKKSKSLVRNLTEDQRQNLARTGKSARFFSRDARVTSSIRPGSVQLTVTSPPFLDVVDYRTDNWLRCWFNAIDDRETSQSFTLLKKVEDWSRFVGQVFEELHRITKRGGWVAFEVGEVRNGRIKLEEFVVPQGMQAGFRCEGILINSQHFTKTSNIWGISNNRKGTNTNRIVLFHKP